MDFVEKTLKNEPILICFNKKAKEGTVFNSIIDLFDKIK
ncbi:MAG: hypothetical protein RLZZ420_803 [Bacteroidota bacterium]|jgi:hypothetical protein